MRMKGDAMGNGQLKPAYNLQHGGRFRIYYMAHHRPTANGYNDINPFFERRPRTSEISYKNITADAGYESEENYVFLEANGQISYIKPANYEISKTRKYRNDIGKIENMGYDAESDAYICRNRKRLMAGHTRHSKSKTGYISEKTVYKCEDCSGCPYKAECIGQQL